jgi:hypothetical protein
MKNKAPLLVAEPREMIAAGDSKSLRDFRESGPPTLVTDLFSKHSVEQACALLRSSEMPRQIVLTPADYLFHPLDRDRDQSGKPIAGRVAP